MGASAFLTSIIMNGRHPYTHRTSWGNAILKPIGLLGHIPPPYRFTYFTNVLPPPMYTSTDECFWGFFLISLALSININTFSPLQVTINLPAFPFLPLLPTPLNTYPSTTLELAPSRGKFLPLPPPASSTVLRPVQPPGLAPPHCRARTVSFFGRGSLRLLPSLYSSHFTGYYH